MSWTKIEEDERLYIYGLLELHEQIKPTEHIEYKVQEKRDSFISI